MELLKIKKIFDDLGAVNGRKAKEEILNCNKNNILFREILDFVYNPYIVTGISSKKIEKDLPMLETMTQDITCVMDYIKRHNTGRDGDIAFVKTFIKCMPKELEEFLVGVFTKNLKVGITAKTINKIFKNLIPEHEVMLAEKYSDNIKRVEGKEFILSIKLDGTRVTVFNTIDGVKIYSRQGQAIEGLTQITREFEVLPYGVYDGELCATGHFKSSKDMFKETMKRSRVKGEKLGLKMVCFDYIKNPEHFYMGKDETPCIKRKFNLISIMIEAKTKHSISHIESLDVLYYGDDMTAIDKFVRQAMADDEEGIMLNIADAPYECKRSKNLLKVKVFNTADLRVVGYEEGTGRNLGKLGALVVDYKGNKVKVGSGFTDSQRESLWLHRYDQEKSLIGKIIEVQYFEESKNEQGGLSLRFPTFLRVRDDKTEISLY
jgi:DNA ligase-1